MKTKIEELTQASHKMAEAMYKSSAEADAAAKDTDPQAEPEVKADKKKDDDVVDAEFEESKDS